MIGMAIVSTVANAATAANVMTSICGLSTSSMKSIMAAPSRRRL
jgi:hypothetical protein